MGVQLVGRVGDDGGQNTNRAKAAMRGGDGLHRADSRIIVHQGPAAAASETIGTAMDRFSAMIGGVYRHNRAIGVITDAPPVPPPSGETAHTRC